MKCHPQATHAADHNDDDTTAAKLTTDTNYDGLADDHRPNATHDPLERNQKDDDHHYHHDANTPCDRRSLQDPILARGVRAYPKGRTP